MMQTAPRMNGRHVANFAVDVPSMLAPDDVPGFVSDVMRDGDTPWLPLGTAADVLGMTESAGRMELSRESLYRTRSDRGDLLLDALEAIRYAFDLGADISKAKRMLVTRRPWHRPQTLRSRALQ